MILGCFGDSITEGYLVPPEAAWPSVLQRISGITTLNFGVSGDTTSDGIRRLKAVLSRDMDAVFLEFGLNDFFMGIPRQLARDNLARMATAFLQKDIKVILAGFVFSGQGSAGWHEMYLELAQTLELPLYQDIFRGLSNCESCFLPDGLHPNRRGYEIMAEEICSFLKDTLPLAGLR